MRSSRVTLPVLVRMTGAPTRLERTHALGRLAISLAPGYREDVDHELLDAAMYSKSEEVRVRAADDLLELICDRFLELVVEYHAMHPSLYRDEWMDEHIGDMYVALGELPAPRWREIVALRLDLVGGASHVEIDFLLSAPARRAAA